MHNLDYNVSKFLIESGVSTLPINVENLKLYGKEVGILTYQSGAKLIKKFNLTEYTQKCKAFTIRLEENDYIIFYNEKLSNADKKLVILHEFGHIVLDHTSLGIVVGKSLDENIDNMQEAEAEQFVLKTIAPLTILKRAGITKPEQIEIVAGIPIIQATYIARLLKTEKPYITPQDLILLENFKPFIKSHKRTVRKRYFKLVGYALLIALALTAAYVSVEQFPKIQHAVIEMVNEGKVFVTPTGNKFHTYDCQHVKNLKTAKNMTVEEALAEGYEQCAICRPLERYK